MNTTTVQRIKQYKDYIPGEFIVERDDERCIRCKVCVNQCSFEANFYDEDTDRIYSRHDRCVSCQRCVALCPTDAIVIRPRPSPYHENANWTANIIRGVHKRSRRGGVLISGMGNDLSYPIYWDHLLLNASQVTNPSIDPLREPMELRTFLGKKPNALDIDLSSGDPVLRTQLAPQLKVEVPILFSAMSYGAISANVCEALARAAQKAGTYYNTGEGGLHRDYYKYGPHTIVQVASGRFGVHKEYLDVAAAIEIKIGQGAKPGIGGHLPGEKVDEQISQTRMIPVGTDALSPAPHHDIYSIEDLRQLIFALKEATEYTKPISVKISAVHNVAAIASGIVRAGADLLAIDGFRGGTGGAPDVIKENVGLPIELALAAVDTRLREEGIRNEVSLIACGGIRSSGDVAKAIALGADAVYIGTAALLAVGCTLCQQCFTGKCAWGITTQDPYLTKRVNPDIATQRLYNLLTVWGHELKEILGAMGLNAIESLRGNRLHLRAVGLSEPDMEILGVMPAGI